MKFDITTTLLTVWCSITKGTGNPESDSTDVDVVHSIQVMIHHELEVEWNVGLVWLQDLIHHCPSQQQLSQSDHSKQVM